MGRRPKDEISSSLKKMLRTVGGNIRLMRQKKRWTQAELARRSRISPTTLNEIETKRLRDIRLATLVSIGDALQVDPILFFRESDVPLKRDDCQQIHNAAEELYRLTMRLYEETQAAGKGRIQK